MKREKMVERPDRADFVRMDKWLEVKLMERKTRRVV